MAPAAVPQTLATADTDTNDVVFADTKPEPTETVGISWHISINTFEIPKPNRIL